MYVVLIELIFFFRLHSLNVDILPLRLTLTKSGSSLQPVVTPSELIETRCGLLNVN